MNLCLVYIVSSASGNSHAITVKLGNVTDFIGVFSGVIRLSMKIRTAPNTHHFVPRPRIAVVDGYPFTISVDKVLPPMLCERAAIIGFIPMPIERSMPMAKPIAFANATVVNLYCAI